ncbi:MAG: hypothetical protein EHM58_00140 [Ignavibacteriae bacterium]|nr:MAG: hypothetical protein EHM58_00140 [Ignavibacteriota bacterium]
MSESDSNKMFISEFTVIINDIKLLISKGHQMDSKDKHFLMQSLYLLETNIDKIKNDYKLHKLNNSVSSVSIKKSFLRNLPTLNVNDENTYQFKEYFNSVEYQYWFLVFLLLNNQKIRENNTDLHKVIDDFIERIKDESFNYEDIVMTKSGATRCKTNLRFTVNSLRDAGLLSRHDRNNKRSWSLSYIGLFVALSICLHPDQRRNNPFAKKIHKLNIDNWIFDVDPELNCRIQKLSSIEYFNSLVIQLELDSLELPNLKKGPEIFKDVFKIYQRTENDLKKRIKNEDDIRIELEQYFKNLDEKYELQGFMDDVSLKFNAEDWFRDIINVS